LPIQRVPVPVLPVAVEPVIRPALLVTLRSHISASTAHATDSGLRKAAVPVRASTARPDAWSSSCRGSFALTEPVRDWDSDIDVYSDRRRRRSSSSCPHEIPRPMLHLVPEFPWSPPPWALTLA
jgi:hypothetical protein